MKIKNEEVFFSPWNTEPGSQEAMRSTSMIRARRPGRELTGAEPMQVVRYHEVRAVHQVVTVFV